MSTHDAPSPLGDLPRIGRPATSALMAAGVTTLTQVAALGHRELLGMHGVGPKAVLILVEALREHGLELAD